MTSGLIAATALLSCTCNNSVQHAGTSDDAGPNRGGSGTTSDAATGDAGSAEQPPPPPPNTNDPIEPVWQPDKVEARVKSPGPQMHFTANLPFRTLADANDPLAWECPPGHPPYACTDSTMTFSIDGTTVGTIPPDAQNENLWELRMPAGLPAGDHVLAVRFKPHAASAVDGLVPVTIHVDPPPAHANHIDLTSDLVLTGATDLDWTDASVNGHGHTVTTAPGYTGKITIHGSFVTSLAAFDNRIGIDVATSNAVDIANTIFEATAPLRIAANGSAPIRIANNEFRSSNYVTYVSGDPTRSPILDLSGTTSGSKVMQGNNIGAGIVHISGMPGWQIGGLVDTQSNILVGPRCVIDLESSPGATIQGNYLHHDYYGGFSQGFNLQLGGSSDHALAEHNVIRDGSWPLQGFGGEFRYNLMINSGHDFIRSSKSQTRFHHNVFAHAQAPNSAYDAALFVYGGEQNLAFDNNTIDAGGAVGAYDAPAIVVGAASVSFTSIRNNAFTQFAASRALVAAGATESSVAAPRVATADYNAWFDPLAPSTSHYMTGLVAATAGGHDVTGDPKFVGAVPQVPYQIDEGAVWLRQYGVSQVLGYYRALYTPRAGSPLVDAGDPADGAGNDIGAIGAGTPNAADKFGLDMQAH